MMLLGWKRSRFSEGRKQEYHCTRTLSGGITFWLKSPEINGLRMGIAIRDFFTVFSIKGGRGTN